MLNVLITGGCGFIAEHLIKYLQENSSYLIGEIRTVDRKPFNPFLTFPMKIPIAHHRFDLTDTRRLEKVLQDVDVVFHLARKRFEFKFHFDQSYINKLYMKDNLHVTKCLMEAMVNASVSNLIYVGDAYANLPPQDNFGTSEAMHGGEPSSYLLGEYGFTRTQAELHARNFNERILFNGKILRCVFLRPTFVYGEGDFRLPEALHALAFFTKEGVEQCVPHFEGPSNGMHQYIYAGTLAKVAEASMRCLIEDSKRCSGEYFYCMDETNCTKFTQFFKPIIHSLGYRTTNENNSIDGIKSNESYYFTYAKTIISEFISRQIWRMGWNNAKYLSLNSYALRLFFGLAFGFSDRKQRIILARVNVFEICAAESKDCVSTYLARTAAWVAEKKIAKNRNCVEENVADLNIMPINTASSIPPRTGNSKLIKEKEINSREKLITNTRVSRMG